MHKELRYEGEGAIRLDKFIAQSEPDVSRVQFQQLIAEGGVCVNGVVQQKPALKLEPGTTVTYSLPEHEEAHLLHQAIAVDVIYVDENVIVVNKPAGMVVHPAPGNWTGTLVNALMGRGQPLAAGGAPERAGLVHRLDKDTSGLLIVAKSDTAHRALSAALAARRITRRYAELC